MPINYQTTPVVLLNTTTILMIDINYFSRMYHQNPPTDIIRIEAQLGNPQAECKGFGICTLDEMEPDTWSNYRPYHIQRMKALLSWLENHLHMEFPVNGMLVPTRAHFFAKGTFLLESEAVLPAWLCEKWDLAYLSIPSGTYACTLRNDAFEVNLPIAWQLKDMEMSMALKKAV